MIPQSKPTHAAYLLPYFCLISTCIIAGRLFFLQLYHGPQFCSRSKQNYTRYEKINCPRGNILDCNNNVLVTNTPLIHLYWHGTGNRQLNDQQRESIAQLAALSDTLCLNEQLIAQIAYAEKRNNKALLLKNISMSMLGKVEELFAQNANMLIETDCKRYYPYNDLASHLIGYLGNVRFEAIGKMGLEKQFNRLLQGNEGTLLKTINSYGKLVSSKQIKQTTTGTTIATTLDLELQKLAEQAFGKEHVGAFILMDPLSGNIKALVSRPSFDPNVFLDPLRPKEWQAMQKNKPFLNRAVNCCYPPGSLFKLVTISAALENDLITQEGTHICEGYYTFSGRKYWCARRHGHGAITPIKGLALSCNSLFYHLGTKLSIDTLADYAARFGLGQQTGFLFNEQSGLVPSSSWKQENKGERWWPGETLSAAIGQSFLLVTPLQVARMISAIFTGYLVKPRILANKPIKQQPLQLKPETITFLRNSMRSVVTQGTGRRVNHIRDITIYAKTSTAQNSNMNKRNLGKQYFEHGWMVAYFYYKDHDPLTLVVLVEHAGSSRVPAIIAKDFLLSYRDLLQ